MHTKRTILNNIIDWTHQRLSPNFNFHEYQLDVIADIIYNILNKEEEGHENYILEAPTGSGKSIICIVSAGVLAEYYHMQSYILCSDLYLWQQYYDFICKAKLSNFGYLKGQTGNYTCMINNEDMRNSDCRIRGLSWKVLMDSSKASKIGYRCSEKCEYVLARKKAKESDVCLMTYQLFLYMLNVVGDAETGFGGREVIFCDECHNIPDIVQAKYTPTIKEEDFKYLQLLYEAGKKELERQSVADESKFKIYQDFSTLPELMSSLHSMFVDMCKQDLSALDNIVLMNVYYNIFDSFKNVVDLIEGRIARRKECGNSSAEDIKIYKNCSYYKNTACHWGDFLTAVSEAGSNYLIKQVEYNNEQIPTVSFNCVKEDYMVSHYLLKHTPHRVMMSATVGGKIAFEENIGIKYTSTKVSKMSRVPSTFDFSKSPIKVFTKYKMTYEKKDYSFEQLKPLIYKLINKFEGKKGLIQTGSYKNAKELYYTSPPEIKKRLLIYNDSKEKNIMLKKHKASKDTIIIGPSLAEGIDLPDDLCRFIIILKVPYPTLTSKLVKAKMKLFPNWYASTTSNIIIQGIGRGNRNKTDYCQTFILDGCFKRLYNETKEQYSPELQHRIKFYD
ncbi:helicase C-terminal domain-containing protein [uncultured Methanobrevibacter sp.]|uniref:helicase C-terminal domain-containing protein n=1 Tax=uncultured Methanobrevibacter sp. TaxID=253161 RepID=UPI0025ECB9A2|nr:helicase C-terminal domain-containing protein [uncultured Methanobrevibacter sp.]